MNIYPFAWIVAFFAILFIYTKFLGPIPFSVDSTVTQKTVTFDVTGGGKVSVTPDIARISAGVVAQAQTVKQAQNQLNLNINKVSEAVKNTGVDPKDIKTESYNVYPVYDYSGSSQKITNYSASANLAVTVRDIDKINAVIDTATQSGANQISGLSLEVENKEKAENEAREQAVAEAKKKAENAAKIAGFSLGKIVNYSESFEGLPRPLSLVGGGIAEKTVPTQIEPGSSQITVVVTLSYGIR